MARILLVDDEEPVRGFLKRGLELDGHTVATAIDGGDGLDRLAERDDRFDLLLTDIRMPMMDGIALAHAAKREHPDLVIPAHDRLRRPARARGQSAGRGHGRADEAVLARRGPRRGGPRPADHGLSRQIAAFSAVANATHAAKGASSAAGSRSSGQNSRIVATITASSGRITRNPAKGLRSQ